MWTKKQEKPCTQPCWAWCHFIWLRMCKATCHSPALEQAEMVALKGNASMSTPEVCKLFNSAHAAIHSPAFSQAEMAAAKLTLFDGNLKDVKEWCRKSIAASHCAAFSQALMTALTLIASTWTICLCIWWKRSKAVVHRPAFSHALMAALNTMMSRATSVCCMSSSKPKATLGHTSSSKVGQQTTFGDKFVCQKKPQTESPSTLQPFHKQRSPSCKLQYCVPTNHPPSFQATQSPSFAKKNEKFVKTWLNKMSKKRKMPRARKTSRINGMRNVKKSWNVLYLPFFPAALLPFTILHCPSPLAQALMAAVRKIVFCCTSSLRGFERHQPSNKNSESRVEVFKCNIQKEDSKLFKTAQASTSHWLLCQLLLQSYRFTPLLPRSESTHHCTERETIQFQLHEAHAHQYSYWLLPISSPFASICLERCVPNGGKCPLPQGAAESPKSWRQLDQDFLSASAKP